MPMRTQRIWKATGIPVHVMLMADMQNVIKSQQSVITQVEYIEKEFGQREVGHTIFQVQNQVEKMLSSFESRVVTKLDSLHQKLSSSTDKCSPSGLSVTVECGR